MRTMTTVCALGFGVVLMSLTVADAAPAQDAIEPASSVRVVEARSRFSGQLVRQVVEDLERNTARVAALPNRARASYLQLCELRDRDCARHPTATVIGRRVGDCLQPSSR
jgi:hypothetical protein